MAGRSRRRHHCRRLGGVRGPTPDGCRCSRRRCCGERLQLSASLIRALLRPLPDVAAHHEEVMWRATERGWLYIVRDCHSPRPRSPSPPGPGRRQEGQGRVPAKAPEDVTGRAHPARGHSPSRAEPHQVRSIAPAGRNARTGRSARGRPARLPSCYARGFGGRNLRVGVPVSRSVISP